MSFKCEKCKKSQPPKSSPILHVVQTRSKVYTNEAGEETGRGTEIVKAIKICKKCDDKIKKDKEKENLPQLEKCTVGNCIHAPKVNK